MADIFSEEKRSDIMSKISGKETKPEVLVRKYLFSHGFRYRKNVKDLPGKPDIVLSRFHTIVWCMDVFGTDTRVRRPNCRVQGETFGKEKFNKTL